MPENYEGTVSGLLGAIEGLLPSCDQRRAATILAAAVRQLSSAIDYRQMLVADAESHAVPDEKDWEKWN